VSEDKDLGLEGLDEEFNLVEQAEIERVATRNERRLRAEAILRQKRVAYGRVFVDGNATAADAKIVLDDLIVFCRANRSTFNPNVQVAARLDGRREVYLRIREYLDLSIEELMQTKFGG
jgi:hypothetical protein